MALKLDQVADFIGRISAPNSAYPFGSAKDESSAGAGDGTPYIKARADDVFGMQQSLLTAGGITPNNNPDSVTNPQYLAALSALGWSQYANYQAGSRVLRTGRLFEALAATGPLNGGSVDPATVDNGAWVPANKRSGNLIANAKAEPIITVNGTPQTIPAGTEIASGWFVGAGLVDVTYVDGEYDATSGTMYYDVAKDNGIGEVALSALIASTAKLNGGPTTAGVTTTDETTAWRVTVDFSAASGVFSTQLERDAFPTRHDLADLGGQGAPGKATTAQAEGLTDDEAYLTSLKGKQLVDSMFSNNSLVEDGWQELPGGLIFQWGFVQTSFSGESVPLPITFPNSGFSVVATDNDSASVDALSASFDGNSAIIIWGEAGSGSKFFMAIGH